MITIARKPGPPTPAMNVAPQAGASAGALAESVHHRDALAAGTPLESAQRVFARVGLDYLPVVDAERFPVGLCSRAQVGHLLGSRFGFALHSQISVESALVPRPMLASLDEPEDAVVERAMARRGAEFVEDVILVDARGALVGLVRAECLAQLQSRRVERQMRELREQEEQLRRRNVELFEANHALRQSRGLYFGLLDHHALGVALLDSEGRVQARNRRLEELVGPAADDGQPWFVERVVERDRAEFARMLARCEREPANAPTREFTLSVPGRGPRLFRCSMGWIRETSQACVCLDDITEQRALERGVALREKQSLLETLVGGVAHELNNKLTPIRGFAELLQLETAGSARSYARLIARSVDEASRIVRQLRELSSHPGAETRQLDLRVVVEEALAMLQFRVRKAGCELRGSLPEKPVWVRADPGQIKQVLMNLGANAVDALQGRPQPALAITLEARDGQARLTVEDNGEGIRAENLPRIFDPFFTTKSPDRGTGLGLSICLGIVRQSGGEITAASEPGRGAVFVVTLPLVEPREGEPAPAGSTSPGGALAARPALDVLVVDDEEVIRHLVQEQVRRLLSCRVETAANGEEALAAVRRAPPDLILVDVIMPGMGGCEFYEHLLEERPELADRVAFVSGYTGGESVEARLALWRRPLLEKPFTIEGLAAVCRAVLPADWPGLDERLEPARPAA